MLWLTSSASTGYGRCDSHRRGEGHQVSLRNAVWSARACPRVHEASLLAVLGGRIRAANVILVLRRAPRITGKNESSYLLGAPAPSPKNARKPAPKKRRQAFALHTASLRISTSNCVDSYEAVDRNHHGGEETTVALVAPPRSIGRRHQRRTERFEPLVGVTYVTGIRTAKRGPRMPGSTGIPMGTSGSSRDRP